MNATMNSPLERLYKEEESPHKGHSFTTQDTHKRRDVEGFHLYD
jgi:hypothetical protein